MAALTTRMRCRSGWMPRQVSWPRLKGGWRSEFSTSRLPPGHLDQCGQAHVVGALAAVTHQRLDIGAVVQNAHPAGHLHRIAMQPIHLAAHRQTHFLSDARRRRLPGFLWSIQADHALGGPLAQHLGQDHGAVARRAAADVVAGIDEDDRQLVGLQSAEPRR